MKTYTLSPQGISRIRRRFLQRMSLFLGIICLAVVGVNLWVIPNNGMTATIASIIVCIGVMTFALLRVLSQNKEIWESIRIEITDEYIARSQVRIPQIRITRQEITSIEERDGGICIRTDDESKTLFIPSDLDENDYQEIRNKLSSWIAIQPKSQKAKTQNAILLVLLIVGFGILFLSWSLWVVLLAGVSLTGYYVYYYWSLRKTKGIDPKFRRSTLISILFLLFVMIMKVCLLSGGIDFLIRSR